MHNTAKKGTSVGGPLSGFRAANTKMPRCDDLLFLDMADLKRLHLLDPGSKSRSGTLAWTKKGEGSPFAMVGFSLRFDTAASTPLGTLRLGYAVGQPQQSVDYSIRMESDPCRFGGVGWWFACPVLCGTGRVACRKRARALYLHGRYFGCRYCHELTYESRQRSDSRAYRILRNDLLPSADQIRGYSRTGLALLLRAVEIRDRKRNWFRRPYVLSCST
jgi:hypothetical protein